MCPIQRLTVLDADMATYIHDNSDDEFTHQDFLNAYLISKQADPVDLEKFRTLPGSTATGSSGKLRLTNLMQLTIGTSWWTRYRSDSKNPEFGDTFPQAVPTLAVGQHTAIPRTDNDTMGPNFLQAIANTAAFHFPTIANKAATASTPPWRREPRALKYCEFSAFSIDCSPCQGTARRRTVPSPRAAKGLETTSRILSSAFFLLRGILRWR
jgi:hypothetical protein